MKVLLDWLRDFVAVDLPPRTLAEKVSLSGLAVDRVLEEGGATVLDLDVASNRPDLLGHYGVAREIAAILRKPLTALAEPKLSDAAAAVQVRIEAPEACGRYLALQFDAPAALPSPVAMARRLEQLGHRGINFWADLTNYTLWETGHPTHAFDADTLRGGEVRVRWARAGETLITLDEVERKLTPEDLVIADAERPIALAGVMGGLETSIRDRTRRVVLESAWFEPLMVRRMARRHALHTDASHRFERGADPEGCGLAAARIAGHGLAAGARLAARGEAAGTLPQPAAIRLRMTAVERALGQAMDAAECRQSLQALGCTLEGEAWRPPSWRADLAREIDLIEEIARLHGLEHFPARLPAFQGAAQPLPEAGLRDRVRQQLRGRGFAEAVTISFAAEAECAVFSSAAPVRVLNPLSEEAAILRTSSLPGMLHSLRHNLNHGVATPRLFEIGKIYQLAATRPEEHAVLTVAACDAGLDFAGFKGEIDAVLRLFNLPAIEYTTEAPAHLHPGRRAGAGNWGHFGQLHPDFAAAWKLPPQVWLAELDLAALYARGSRPIHYVAPPRFPASERDFSFWLADTILWEQVAATLAQSAIPFLADAHPAEIFRDPKRAGQYSLLLRARFQSAERTLRDEEVQAGADAITARLRTLGGEQR
ncbi:MAG: phenylalanine--tRNA ligase subunit beta [Terriglobales bacterium]